MADLGKYTLLNHVGINRCFAKKGFVFLGVSGVVLLLIFRN